MTDGMMEILKSLNINPEDMPIEDNSDDFILSVLLEKDVFDKCWECSSDFRNAYLKYVYRSIVMNKYDSGPDLSGANHEYWDGYRAGCFEAIDLLRVIPCIRQIDKEK